MQLPSQLAARMARLSGRSRAIGMYFATALAARGVGIACQIVQVPIALGALGTEAFGLWMTLTSLGTVILFADLGMGQGAQNKLAEAFARGDGAEARVLWGSAWVFLSTVGAVLAVVAVLATRWLDPAVIFNVTDAAAREQTRAATLVTLLLFCANVPLGLAQRLAQARQRGWMHNIAQAAGSVGALAGTVLGVFLRWPLAGIIAAAQVPPMMANAVLLLVQTKQLRWAVLRGIECRRETIRELLGLGGHFGIQQVQLTMFVALPPLVISSILGPAAVTPYNLAQRLFNLFSVVQNAFMLPLWPAYSEAKARGEIRWIRRTLARSFGATVFCTLLPMTAGAVFAQPILQAWIGRTGEAAELPSLSLVWLLFAWNALVFLGQPFGFMLAGLSEIKRLTQTAVISTVTSAGLMIALVPRWGPEGVVAGMIIGILPFIVIGNIGEALRILGRLRRARSHTNPFTGEALSLRALDSP